MRSLLHSRLARASMLALAGASVAVLASCGGGGDNGPSAETLAQGRQIFRFDTFGDETKWTDTLRINEPIEQAVTPRVALQVGLKVDADALPDSVKQGIQNGTVDLDSTATTLALIKLNAVVGVKGTVETVNGVDRLTRVGVTCALCHSTVDNSFSAGIGKRLDGWPNRDLAVGTIISLSPALDAATKATFASWPKGMYDPRFNCDGLSKPAVIPPAYGLQNIHKITFTGDGDNIMYWNRYVSVTQMGGHGTFTDSRLAGGIEANCASVTNGTDDLVSSKLPALQDYQLSILAPRPPEGSFNVEASLRGLALFQGKARCASCHTGATFTDANVRLHPVSDSMAEPEVPSYASRSATKQYRTSPLRGVWQHAPYFHNGTAATLDDVVTLYNTRMALGLTAAEMADVVQYLKSL